MCVFKGRADSGQVGIGLTVVSQVVTLPVSGIEDRSCAKSTTVLADTWTPRDFRCILEIRFIAGPSPNEQVWRLKKGWALRLTVRSERTLPFGSFATLRHSQAIPFRSPLILNLVSRGARLSWYLAGAFLANQRRCETTSA